MRCRLVRSDGSEKVIDHAPTERTLVLVEGDASHRTIFRRSGWEIAMRTDGETVVVGATYREIVPRGPECLSGLEGGRGWARAPGPTTSTTFLGDLRRYRRQACPKPSPS